MNAILIVPLVSIIICASSLIAGEDVRSKVGGSSRARFEKVEVDPESKVYGVAFGASEDEFIRFNGKPDGYVRLNDAHTAMLYGRSRAVIFKEGKLSAVRVTGQILDWKLSSEFQKWNSSDNQYGRLSNGIFLGMDLKQIRKILGENLRQGEFGQHYYTTANARVELDFAQYRDRGDGDDAYILHGFYVAHGASAKSEARPEGRFGADLSKDTEKFGGIGAILREQSDTGEIEIIDVTPDGPAAKAGLQGLQIRSVDDVPLAGRSLREVVEALRGRPGSSVKVEVLDPNRHESRKIELVREEITPSPPAFMRDRTNITVTTDQVLRLEAVDGARAVVHFFGFTKEDKSGAGDGQETANYRWRFTSAPGRHATAGTNTTVNRYTSKLIGPNEFQLLPRSSTSLEDAKIKIGEFRLEWSYGYTNKGYIYCNPAKLKATVVDITDFEKKL